MRAIDEHGHLPPATRARTILAGRHRVDLAELEAGGSAPAAPGRPAPAADLLEWADATYLVLTPSVRPPRHRIQLTCRAPIAGLGVLRLVGTAGPVVPPPDLPPLMDLLGGRRSTVDHGDAGDDELRPCALTVVRVSVDTVRVLIPATRQQRAHAVSVDLEAYRAAEADMWALEGPRTAATLEARHQQDLRLLAGLRLDGRAVSAVVVRRVTGGHLELGCLDADGVSALRVVLDPPIQHPTGHAAWLRHAARGGPVAE